MIRAVSIIALAAVFAPSVSLASGYKTVCSRGDDARTIEVLTPGSVGQSCDVRYTRSADNVSVPYHADNSDTYCNEKARALAQRLATAGFSCSSAAPVLKAETGQPGQQSDYIVETQRVAPLEETAPEEPTAAPVANAPTASPDAEQQSQPRPVVLEPAPATAGTNTDESALEGEMNEILAQPASDASTSEPAQLVAEPAQTPQQTPQAHPQPSPVGRLTGADPSAPRPAASPTPASTAAAQPAQETEAQKKAPAPAAEQSSPAQKSSALRTPAEIVRATLMAQAAAWNEGDLEGFMDGYWKSDELKFVSGGELTRGWSATMKRYRERYNSEEGLGRLSLERIEPKLVTDDVAVVTGRFALVKDSNTSSGVFTLVMRRDGGVWRIVHDHTNADHAAQ